MVPFDQIFDAVKSGRAEAGLIIHEGQLTYAKVGLHKNCRPRRMVEGRETGLPLPLGGNVVRKDIPARDAARYRRDHARKHRLRLGASRTRRCITRCPTPATWTADLADKFIGMYVNDYTSRLRRKGTRGDQSEFLEAARRKELLDHHSGGGIRRIIAGLLLRLFLRRLVRLLDVTVLTRLNSFWNPFTKSWVPYSKRTMKQNVKNTNRREPKSAAEQRHGRG